MTEEQTLDDVTKQNLSLLNSGEIERQIQQLIKDSPIESYESRRALAEALILSRLQVRQFTQLALEERLTGDMSRALPGLLGQLNKLCQTLRVVAPKDDEDPAF